MTLTPGEHRVSVVIPTGWTVLDQGDEILLQREGGRIAIRDLGPAGRDGVRREVERAREWWRAGRDRDARWRLRRLEVSPALFATAERRAAFWGLYSSVTAAAEDASFTDVEPAFASLLDTVGALEQVPGEEVATAAIAALESDARRETAARDSARIGVRDGLRIETWYRMTHNGSRRYAVVENAGRLLAIATDPGRPEALAPAFEAVVASLRFVGAPVSPEAGR